MKAFTEYENKREFTKDVSDHECLLSFNSDWQSDAFHEWIEDEGMKLFAEWLKENRDENGRIIYKK
jgi:hypothetical protein